MAGNLDEIYAQLRADPNAIVMGVNFTENRMTDGQFFVFSSETDSDEGSSSASGSTSDSNQDDCSQASTKPPCNRKATDKNGNPKEPTRK